MSECVENSLFQAWSAQSRCVSARVTTRKRSKRRAMTTFLFFWALCVLWCLLIWLAEAMGGSGSDGGSTSSRRMRLTIPETEEADLDSLVASNEFVAVLYHDSSKVLIMYPNIHTETWLEGHKYLVRLNWPQLEMTTQLHHWSISYTDISCKLSLGYPKCSVWSDDSKHSTFWEEGVATSRMLWPDHEEGSVGVASGMSTKAGVEAVTSADTLKGL